MSQFHFFYSFNFLFLLFLYFGVLKSARISLLTLGVLIFTLPPLITLAAETQGHTMDSIPYEARLKDKIKGGDTLVESILENIGKEQLLNFKIAALHPKACSLALRKLSRYETFHKNLNFLADSRYDDEKKQVYFLIRSQLLPADMILKFKIPRITKPGRYVFKFEDGFLPGLIGTINVSTYTPDTKKPEQNKCLFFTEATWKGPPTGFPPSVFNFFSEALSRLMMENLIRISNI